jgi:hypothetical protein
VTHVTTPPLDLDPALDPNDVTASVPVFGKLRGIRTDATGAAVRWRRQCGHWPRPPPFNERAGGVLAQRQWQGNRLGSRSGGTTMLIARHGGD